MRRMVTGYMIFPGSDHVETVDIFKILDKRGMRRKGCEGGGGGWRRRRDDC